MGPAGFEPATNRLWAWRSSRAELRARENLVYSILRSHLRILCIIGGDCLRMLFQICLVTQKQANTYGGKQPFFHEFSHNLWYCLQCWCEISRSHGIWILSVNSWFLNTLTLKNFASGTRRVGFVVGGKWMRIETCNDCGHKDVCYIHRALSPNDFAAMVDRCTHFKGR